MLKMKLALLLGAAVAPLLIGNAAFAQVQTADQVDEVVVTGRRPIAESEAAALQVQRNSDSLVSVIASDAVGRLPDQNIAQAVARVPGAAVESDQGQARYVSLRGAPNNWTTLSINGIGIVSPEGRDTRYDSLPSAIASQIVVNKAVTPDLTGETISGVLRKGHVTAIVGVPALWELLRRRILQRLFQPDFNDDFAALLNSIVNTCYFIPAPLLGL